MKREIKRSGSTDFEHNFGSLHPAGRLICTSCEQKDRHRSFLGRMHAVMEAILSSLPWIFLIVYGAICLAVTILCGY